MRIWYNNEKGSYDLHYHDAIEIILCVENQTIIKTTDKTYILNVGDILFIPSQELHELIFEDWGIRFIFLLDTKFLTYYDDFKLLDLIFIKPRLFTSDTEIYHEIYNNLMQMVDMIADFKSAKRIPREYAEWLTKCFNIFADADNMSFITPEILKKN